MKILFALFRSIKPMIIFAAASTLFLGCRILGNPEQKPTTSPDLVATTVAMTMQAITPQAPPIIEATAILPTFTALIATATSAPAPSSTTRPPSGTRINFAVGATAGIMEGQIRPGEVKDFLVGAVAGQPMIVMVDSSNQDVTFSVTGQKDGVVLLSPSQKSTSWQTMLPTTQDYLIQVAGGASATNFMLNVITPARVNFDPGAISAQRSGSTPGGLIVSYVLRASAGQEMTLKLDSRDDNAVLGLYGYQDGQPYLRSASEQTSFEITLPATQDYIIQVIPRGGEVANYELDIQIK